MTKFHPNNQMSIRQHLHECVCGNMEDETSKGI